MPLTSAQLTNTGLTTNFQVQYENILPNQANVIANANALLGVVENEFNVTTCWFNTQSASLWYVADGAFCGVPWQSWS